MKELQEILARLEPAAALSALAPALRNLLVHLDDAARVRYVAGLVGPRHEDKISSMVHL